MTEDKCYNHFSLLAMLCTNKLEAIFGEAPKLSQTFMSTDFDGKNVPSLFWIENNEIIVRQNRLKMSLLLLLFFVNNQRNVVEKKFYKIVSTS
jgi:hypothetical protein